MQFSTATIALAMGYLLQFGAVAALPAEAEAVPALESRDVHTACACQYSSNSAIAGDITARVVGFNTWRWKLDVTETQRFQDGAKFTGYYARGLNGGKIAGKAFYNECRQNGAGDSTCF